MEAWPRLSKLPTAAAEATPSEKPPEQLRGGSCSVLKASNLGYHNRESNIVSLVWSLNLMSLRRTWSCSVLRLVVRASVALVGSSRGVQKRNSPIQASSRSF